VQVQRSFQRALRAGLGIVGGAAQRVVGFDLLSDVLQPQVVLDDLSHLQAPVPTALRGANTSGNPIAAQRSVLLYTPPREGAVIETISNILGVEDIIIRTYPAGATPAGTFPQATLTETFNPSVGTDGFRGTFAKGSTADATVAEGVRLETANTFIPFYLEPNVVLSCAGFTAGNQMIANVVVREFLADTNA
jgi:hypothetical protein